MFDVINSNFINPTPWIIAFLVLILGVVLVVIDNILEYEVTKSSEGSCILIGMLLLILWGFFA